MTTVTTTARRIARRMNSLSAGHGGGFCLFHADGSGGYFYAADSRPPLADGDIKVQVLNIRMSALDVQKHLDAMAEYP